jgi:hypothetical protein
MTNATYGFCGDPYNEHQPTQGQAETTKYIALIKLHCATHPNEYTAARPRSLYCLAFAKGNHLPSLPVNVVSTQLITQKAALFYWAAFVFYLIKYSFLEASPL